MLGENLRRTISLTSLSWLLWKENGEMQARTVADGRQGQQGVLQTALARATELVRTEILIALLSKWPSKEKERKWGKGGHNQPVAENSMAHTSSQALPANTEYVAATKACFNPNWLKWTYLILSPFPQICAIRALLQLAQTLTCYLNELSKSLRHTFLRAATVDRYAYEKVMSANVYYFLPFVPFGSGSVLHFWFPTQRGNL